MGIAVSWDNAEHTIIRFEVAGFWSIEHLVTASHATTEMLSDVGHPVSFIIDITHNESTPPNILSMTRRLFENADSKINMRVIVGANHFAHIFFNTFASIYGSVLHRNPLKFAGTVDEARHLIQQQTIPVTS